MYDVINLTSCFPPFYGINPLPLFLEIFIYLFVTFFIMVALADMIVVLDNSYFHIFSWYICMQLQGATNNVFNHVQCQHQEYYAPCTIHKQSPKNNRLVQMLQHMNWRIAAGNQCVAQGFNFSAGRGRPESPG